MYLLETGKVDIRYEGRTLETVESEGIVCEMSLVDDDARSWSARIRWSSLNVIAWLAFDPLGRWFPGPSGGSSMHCVVSSSWSVSSILR